MSQLIEVGQSKFSSPSLFFAYIITISDFLIVHTFSYPNGSAKNAMTSTIEEIYFDIDHWINACAI